VRLPEIKDLVSRQVDSASDLCALLEIELEELMDRFADRLMEHKEKFGIVEQDE
jgi:hypothetical protein